VDALTIGNNCLHFTTTIGELTMPLLTVEGTTPKDQPAISELERGIFEVTSPFLTSTSLFPHSPIGASDLFYSTFLGGSSNDYGYSIAVDEGKATYVTGGTWSPDFPTIPGTIGDYNGNSDVFIVKLDAMGHDLNYATFLGGGQSDEGFAVDVDSTGAAYVTGSTASTDFPATQNAFDSTYNGGGDTFVVKLNTFGNQIAYATFLGGSGYDSGYSHGIAVDTTGAAYVTSGTDTGDFPITMTAFDTTFNGVKDAFVAKLNQEGSQLLYSTFLGGSNYDEGFAVDVDSTGAAYVTGWTNSSDFPTTPSAFDTTLNGNFDAFIVKLNTTGNLLYATFLGGSLGGDVGKDIAVGKAGTVCVSGLTASFDFPTTSGAFDTTPNEGGDAFVAKLNSLGSGLIYSTFLGGRKRDESLSIAVNGSGEAYVAGFTESSDFPITLGAFDMTLNGASDAFVAKINEFGSVLLYATFLGGNSGDYGRGIAFDRDGAAYVTGSTSSSDFPTTSGSYDTTFNGGDADAFVTKLAMGSGPTPTSTSTATPTSTSTLIPTPSPTATSTPMPTPSPTSTSTPTPTPSPTATSTPTPTPVKLWTFMLYLSGDNNLYLYLNRAIANLEAQPANPNVSIVALFDGDRNNDSWRFLVQPGGDYTIGVNKWYMGELDMGDPQTLANFITWTSEYYPAQHYYLAIADHGRGTTGIAWDDTNNQDYLSVRELQTVLATATVSGTYKIDVVHYDACLMGMLENAYQIKDYADYMVASENLGWSVFAYDRYVQTGSLSAAAEVAPLYTSLAALVTADTTPRELATWVVDRYYSHPSLDSYPRTLAALDLSRVGTVKDAVSNLATALRSNLTANKNYVYAARYTAQKFDSRDYFKIDDNDEYLDIYDLASRLKQYVPDSTVQNAAQVVMDVIGAEGTGLVVAEHHWSGNFNYGGLEYYWNLDGAHGASIYFPPRSGGWGYNEYVNNVFYAFTAVCQWDEFLQDYYGVMGLPPEMPTEPGLPPMLRTRYFLYLPLIFKGAE
jgi:clostripain